MPPSHPNDPPNPAASTSSGITNFNSGTLAGAQNIIVTGGTFNSTSTAVDYGIHELRGAISAEAIHDSAQLARILSLAEAFWTGTHRRVREEVEAWIRNSNSEPILWLSGCAQGGGAAMLREIADEMSSDRQPQRPRNVIASFFFHKRLGRRQSPEDVPPTVSYQLAINVPGMRQIINQIMEDDLTLPTKTIARQLDNLVISPFNHLDTSLRPSPSPVVAIGSLEQCHVHDRQRLLSDFVFPVLHAQLSPLRFVISSAPEPDVTEFFELQEISRITHHIDLDQALAVNIEDDLYAILFRRYNSVVQGQITWSSTVTTIVSLGTARPVHLAMQNLLADGHLEPREVRRFLERQKRWIITICITSISSSVTWVVLSAIYWHNWSIFIRAGCFVTVLSGVVSVVASLHAYRAVNPMDDFRAMQQVRSLCKDGRVERMMLIIGLPVILGGWSFAIGSVIMAMSSDLPTLARVLFGIPWISIVFYLAVYTAAYRAARRGRSRTNHNNC